MIPGIARGGQKVGSPHFSQATSFINYGIWNAACLLETAILRVFLTKTGEIPEMTSILRPFDPVSPINRTHFPDQNLRYAF